MVVFGIGYHLAEIAPDHYDFIIDEPFAAARNDAAQSRTADSLQGEFGLSFDASRAGLILPRGTDAISMHWLAKSNPLTLVANGNAFPVHTMPARIRTSVRVLSGGQPLWL
jgi:hypothetical protein